jgi:uncharacterized membrane protein YkvI
MNGSSWFQRFLLPGFAFNAVVIGGGYATGRELAEFFLPAGPRGGLLAMALATAIWSVVCVATFLFARATGSEDYRSFFRKLLGPFWVTFEAAYVFFIVLILAVFGAAAGALGVAAFGWPPLAGTLCLVGAIAAFTAFGNASVERLFKYATLFLFIVYAVFVLLSLGHFGDRIIAGFAVPVSAEGWIGAGVTYASYNVTAAVIILPVLRYLTSSRDAVTAGLLAGPLAMIPGALFFVCMIAFYPQIGAEALPADFLLRQLGLPILHIAFQFMIFIALVGTGVGAIHAINERIAVVWTTARRRPLSSASRLTVAGALLVGSIFIADRFGFVALIARGYRTLAWIFLAVYILPLLTFGVWRLWSWRASPTAVNPS